MEKYIWRKLFSTWKLWTRTWRLWRSNICWTSTSSEEWRCWTSQNFWFVTSHLTSISCFNMRSFQDIMEQLESVGWVRVEKKESFEITELDVDEIFKMIDMDKSGAISRSVSLILFFIIFYFYSDHLLSIQEARVAFKLLSKRFGIKDVSWWKAEMHVSVLLNLLSVFTRSGPGWDKLTRIMMESWQEKNSISLLWPS